MDCVISVGRLQDPRAHRHAAGGGWNGSHMDIINLRHALRATSDAGLYLLLGGEKCVTARLFSFSHSTTSSCALFSRTVSATLRQSADGRRCRQIKERQQGYTCQAAKVSRRGSAGDAQPKPYLALSPFL